MVDVDASSGWLICEQASGVESVVRFSSAHCNLPEPNSVLTVKFSGYWSSGKLREAYFWRERKDLKWEDVTAQWLEERRLHRDFFDSLGKELGFTKPMDWYQIRRSDVASVEGTKVLQRFGNSLVAALQAVYPEFGWDPEQFEFLSKRTKYHSSTLHSLAGLIEERLKVQSLEEWYSVSLAQIQGVTPLTTLNNVGGLAQFLKLVYPSHAWEVERFSSSQGSYHKSQRLLRLNLEAVFPNSGKQGSLGYSQSPVVREDFLHPELQFESGAPMQLDLFLPEHSLAFEYQGQQHYFDVFSFAQQRQYAERDEMKRRACKSAGITLIEIPFWWDSKLATLKATISQVRPDLIPEAEGSPIPTQLPIG